MSQASSRTTPPTWITPPGRNAAIKYGGNTELQRALRTAVTDHLAQRGMSPHGGAAMLRKTGIILTWLVATYLLLLLWAASWWTFAALGISMGLALAAVGFSIQHDGGHGAYAERPRLSRVAALVLDGIGGSSYMWHHKHVVVSCSGSLDEHIERAPTLIVEVLSPSTEARDRMEKRLAYQSLPSLQEYVLVAQDRVLIEVYRRCDEVWMVERHEAGDSIELKSVATSFAAERPYEDVLDAPA